MTIQERCGVRARGWIPISSQAHCEHHHDVAAPSGGSSARRIRQVLATRNFRRLLFITGYCSSADWLTLLGSTALAASLADSYAAQNFAFSGVIFTSLLPGLLLAPLGGLLADRADRRKVMFSADLARFGFTASIPIIGTAWWLFVAVFLINCASIIWIPAKDAAVPNLLRRPDQVETANQLGLTMTYGISVLVGGGLFVVATGTSTMFGLPQDLLGVNGFTKIAIFIASAFYLISAAAVVSTIPKHALNGRPPKRQTVVAGTGEPPVTVMEMVRDATAFVRKTKLIRGLFIGMTGAFAAGGAVVGAAQTYARSLLGGQAAFGLLLIAVFSGLVLGMTTVPRLAKRLAHERLFGVSIVLAGIALAIVALSPHLAVSIIAVAVVGCCAGTAFLSGLTIIGTRVDDSIRGRVNAIYQSLLKLVAGGSVAATPGLVALVQPHTVEVWGSTVIVDGTRPVMLGGCVLAIISGTAAYRHMTNRRASSLLTDLHSAVTSRQPRTGGMWIAVEGAAHPTGHMHTVRLADWLQSTSGGVLLLTDETPHGRQPTQVAGAEHFVPDGRANALVEAAIRAEFVESRLRPALTAGSIVVTHNLITNSAAQRSGSQPLDEHELHCLTEFSLAGLRPDIAVTLDEPLQTHTPTTPKKLAEQWHGGHVIKELYRTPGRHVVIDTNGTDEDVLRRIKAAFPDADSLHSRLG